MSKTLDHTVIASQRRSNPDRSTGLLRQKPRNDDKCEKLNPWQKVLLFAPIAIWFSYHPHIDFGHDDSMNFKLSITIIYALILALIGLPQIWRERRKLIKDRAVWLVTAFVAWNGMSLIWTANLTRGILTCGIIGILFLIFLSMIAEREKLKKVLPMLVKILIAATVAMCVFGWAQMFAGIWLGQGETLLCNGCTAIQFGFVRPNAFAIEPQFFGNLLLAPTLILLWRILKKQGNWRTNLVFVFIAATLILTLSRGAIFAFGIGVAILSLMQIICIKEWKKVFFELFLTIFAIFVALVTQGFTAAINPNFDETFGGAIAKSLNQLSMGVIKLHEDKTDDPNPPANQTTDQNEPPKTETNKKSTPHFDGYVEESTETRLELSRLALAAWGSNFQHMFFGVGIGASGVEMAQFSGSRGAREIVQNEFIEVLLELGIIGATIFAILIIGFFRQTRSKKYLWAIIAAFLIQWNFFSGYPSALHIYLILFCAFAGYDLPKRAPQN
ncbi:O-antigen ligase family protein [Candidatus Saccharibacteria bacterium]|nr:O-antigen ligase family protein [Candidatus Saccharibacteria bacterium]MCL1963124.1 O-antigen ligase family protein [Candidatus Saccharibacteria bacterium]